MRLEVGTTAPEEVATPLMAVAVASDRPLEELDALDRVVGGVLSRAASAGDFKARKGDRVMGYGEAGAGGPERVLFLGAADSKSLTAEDVRGVGGRAVRAAERYGVESLAFFLGHLGDALDRPCVQAAAEGLVLASWRFEEPGEWTLRRW